MIQINLTNDSNIPIYQQIVERITKEIKSGTIPAGYKLPTVRALSDTIGASRGTVKHAYDTLEQLGLIEKHQGSGTFVCDLSDKQPTSKKEQALRAIDALLDQMLSLSFSMKDIRIFLDLKLQEREYMVQDVQIGAIDCSPEALSVIRDQISSIPHADVYEYLLNSVLNVSRPFNPGLDLYLTTHTHFHDLSPKIPSNHELFQIIMAVPSTTVLEFARITGNVQVGILCASERFAHIMSKNCSRYCLLQKPIKTSLFGNKKLDEFLESVDQLVLPPNHLRFCSSEEQKQIKEHQNRTGNIPIIHRYEIENSSLLYLERKIEAIYEANRNNR